MAFRGTAAADSGFRSCSTWSGLGAERWPSLGMWLLGAPSAPQESGGLAARAVELGCKAHAMQGPRRRVADRPKEQQRRAGREGSRRR